MKRRNIFTASLVLLSLVLSLVFEAVVLPENIANAAEKNVASISSSKLKKAKADTEIIYGGKKLSKKGFVITGKRDGEEYDFIYVPAKVFAKKAGISYKIKKDTVTLEKGGVKVTFTIGKASYTLNSKDENVTEEYIKSVKKKKILYIPLDVFVGLLEKTGKVPEYYVEYYCDNKEICFSILDNERYDQDPVINK